LRGTVIVCCIIKKNNIKNEEEFKMNKETLSKITQVLLDLGIIMNCLAIVCILLKRLCEDEEE
jgi:hypothetical protein